MSDHRQDEIDALRAEVARLTDADKLLRQSHMTTVRGNGELRAARGGMEARIAALTEAVTLAARTFDEYVETHEAKADRQRRILAADGDPEGRASPLAAKAIADAEAKAARNRELAEAMRVALGVR